MNKQQKAEVSSLFNKNSSAKSLDYVAAWYKKSAEYMKETNIHSAFVSQILLLRGNKFQFFGKLLCKKE